jgi:fatty-acyl-CoA synthase
MRLTENDRLCIPVPLYHCFGMVLGCWPACRTGAPWCSRARRSTRWPRCRRCSEERCTALHGVPTMFIAELDHPRFAEFDLSRLRTGIMAGSPCPIETMKRVVAEMHMPRSPSPTA